MLYTLSWTLESTQGCTYVYTLLGNEKEFLIKKKISKREIWVTLVDCEHQWYSAREKRLKFLLSQFTSKFFLGGKNLNSTANR